MPVEIAYLGPEGTYGHQAAARLARRVGSDVALIPYPTISATYIHAAPLCVLPLENTLHGAVLETLDCLLSAVPVPAPAVGSSVSEAPSLLSAASPSTTPAATSTPPAPPSASSTPPSTSADPPPPTPAPSSTPEIIAETLLRIEHVLVARRGVELADIRVVRSHEQALGQSSTYLRTYLPRATLVRYPSTAAAAVSLLGSGGPSRVRAAGEPGSTHGDEAGEASSEAGDAPEAASDARETAAICSRAAYEAHADELELLHVGTQGSEHNYTRFVLVSRRGGTAPDLTDSTPSTAQARHTTFLALPSAAPLDLLTDIVSVHSRPAPAGLPPFPRRYLVELSSTTTPVSLHPGAISLGTYQP
ncbi:prephenate dehydratase [Cryptotrichosporon argae]